jgi:hypothetical protein
VKMGELLYLISYFPILVEEEDNCAIFSEITK